MAKQMMKTSKPLEQKKMTRTSKPLKKTGGAATSSIATNASRGLTKTTTRKKI